MKVILKRRANSPTIAGGLFVRGGARNINEKNAGIEQLTLALRNQGRQNNAASGTVRRELASRGSVDNGGYTPSTITA